MAVPRNRMSNARKNSRRAHDAKKPIQFSPCANCGAPCLSHRVCNACGYYKNQPFLAR